MQRLSLSLIALCLPSILPDIPLSKTTCFYSANQSSILPILNFSFTFAPLHLDLVLNHLLLYTSFFFLFNSKNMFNILYNPTKAKFQDYVSFIIVLFLFKTYSIFILAVTSYFTSLF